MNIQPVSSNPTELSTLADFNMVNKLLKDPQYKIPDYLRSKCISCIENALDNEENPDKVKLTAVNTLLSMDKQNLDVVKVAMPKKVEHIDPRKLNDEQLMEALQEVQRELALKLPKPIDGSLRSPDYTVEGASSE